METPTEPLPVPAYDVLAVKSAQPLPPSPPVKLQAIPMTPLVLATLHMVSATDVTMVIPDSLASVTGGPCQDNAPDTSDLPCIDLLGGEILPSQLTCLSADQESKKLHPLNSAHQDIMDSLLPSPPLENVDTSELPMSNAVLESTMPQVPDFPDVAQALSGHSTAVLLHAGPDRAIIGDDIWSNPHPPPLVATSTAPTVPGRPPAAPDPVTGVTLSTTAAPYDCTTLQLGQPPDGAIQAIPVIVTLPETHACYDCHHSEMLLSHPLDGAVDNTDGDNKEFHGKWGEDSICFDLAVPDNHSVLLYPPVVGEPTVEKCTLDLLMELPLIHTIPGYNGSSMTAIPRDWAHLKSTLGLHIELPAHPNDPAGNHIMLLQGDPLPASENNMHPFACIDDKPPIDGDTKEFHSKPIDNGQVSSHTPHPRDQKMC